MPTSVRHQSDESTIGGENDKYSDISRKKSDSEGSSARRPSGRPTKLTPEVQSKIVNVLRTGCFRETAAASVGIDSSTLRDWLRNGARAREIPNNKRKPNDRLCLSFLEAVEEVEAQVEIRDVSVVRKAGEDLVVDVVIEKTLEDGSVEKRTEKKILRYGNPQAKQWFLERRGNRRWGYKASLKLEMSDAVERLLDAAKKVLSEEDYERLLSAVAATSSESPLNESGKQEATDTV